jgi:putative membrane protein insertion efficiency factor
MMFTRYLRKLISLISWITKSICILLIRLYQLLVSPFLGKQCRFHPSCSQYALEAVIRYGSFKGSQLTFLRLAKCHPWHPGGIDLVPNQRIKK